MGVRDLPPLSSFAGEVQAAIGGGTSTVIEEGDHPALALAPPGAGHLVLVRDHGHVVTLSLPTDTSWSLQTRAEWSAIAPLLKRALAAYRPGSVAMADAVATFGPALARMSGRPWRGRVPGTPVPQEMWLKGQGSIGLFQSGGRVRIVVWVGSEMHAKSVASPSELPPLVPWLEDTLRLQHAAAKAAAAEEERKRALPLPATADVLAALRTGKRIIVVAGRAGLTYVMENGALRRDVYEEADHWSEDATEEQLAKDIASYPDRFRNL